MFRTGFDREPIVGNGQTCEDESAQKKSRRKPQTSDGSNAMDGPVTADPAMCETFCTKGIAPVKVYPLSTPLARGTGSLYAHRSAKLAVSQEVDQCQH